MTNPPDDHGLELTHPIPDPQPGPLVLGDQDSIQTMQIHLARQAKRQLLIFTRDLDPYYFDQIPFLDAVRKLALARPYWPVRVLLLESRPPVSRGHRLIGLARQLTSRIGIRRPPEDFRDRTDAFLVVDGRAYCRRPLASAHEAIADLNAPREARLIRADFERMWERSEDDLELRRLHL